MTDEALEAARTFLAERPDGEAALEAVLEADADAESWTFDDVALDSGTFGELVSRGIVERTDGEYRLADPEGVEAVLAGEERPTATESGRFPGGLPSFEPGVWGDTRALFGLVGALALVVAMRLTQYGSVFRGDDVVSPGNDPYFYRYWVEELLAESTSPTDVGLLAELPSGATTRRPLTHALNWWFATILGGDQWAADMVAAWLPVVATVALGVVVYALAVVLTRDVRVGIASVVLLAVTPVHAVYTQVGFLEHRLHQYLWLGVTVLALAWLAVDFSRRRESTGDREALRGHLSSPVTWAFAVVLGSSLGISVHLWGGSPLLFVPLAAYIGLRALLDVREDVSPALANLPVLVGVAIGAGIAIWIHTSWGWRLAFVAYTPAMVLGGALAVVALGELWRRLGAHVGGLAALEAGVAVLGVYLLREYRPEDWANARDRAADLFFREGYTESASLFTFEYGVVFGPLIQLGVGFYLGIAVLAWTGWVVSRRYEPAWLLLGVYTSVLLVFAGIQVRFAAQSAIPLSVLGGVGFVYVLSTIDLARRPLPFRSSDRTGSAVADGGDDEPAISLPDGRKAAYLLGVGVLVCGLSLIYVPGLSGQVSYDDAEYEAVMAIDDHAAELDREYPESYVLSRWGASRMHNYFVNGESRSYGYARSNFEDFRLDDDPDGYYEEFGDRVGYVLVTDERDAPSESVQAQLLEDLGSGGADGEALEHYQLLYVDEDRSVAAFALVPGVTLEATGEPGESVTVSGEVSVSGETVAYERTVEVGEDGRLEVTVSNPGSYSIGDERVEVSERDVVNGSTLGVE